MTSTIFNLAGPDLLIIFCIFFLLFGAKQIPKWAKSLRQTRDELNKLHDDIDKPS